MTSTEDSPARVPPPEPKSRPRWRVVLARTATAAGYAAAVIAAVALLVRQLSLSWQPSIVAASAVPVLLAVAFVGFLASALSRLRCTATAVSGVLVGCLILTQAPDYLNRAPALAPGGSIRLLTGNLRLGSADPAALVALALESRADVVAFQELTVPEAAALRTAGLDKAYPYSKVAAAGGAAGVGLWSRLQLAQTTEYPGLHFRLVSGVIDLVGHGSVTVFSSHMSAPWPQPPAAWAADVHALSRVLSQTPGPIIDAGDFNATNDNAQFRQMLSKSDVRDGARQSGSAVTFSYPTDMHFVPPLIAIDHVLVRTVKARSVHTVTLSGSDHRGVVSEIGFGKR